MTESELILTYIFNCNRSNLYLKRFSLDKENLSKFNWILTRRKEHCPLAYLLGEVEFMGLNFKVSEGVFIPRQETEIVTETVIKIAKLFQPKADPPLAENCHTVKLLDIGTGCGNIAISLAKFIPNARIIATDISSLPLDVAKENARRIGVQERVEFIQTDLFPYLLPTTYYLLDIIVSNPPYISTKDIETLPLEIQFEPKISLDGGRDGLDFYRRIAKFSPKFLKRDGFLILEIGFGQCEKIKEIFKDFKIIDIIKDYSDIDRVIIAQLKKPVTRNQ